MGSTIGQIVDDIVNDATKTLNKVTNYVAKRAADDWEHAAKSVMDDYYNTETAGYYERTDSLRNTIHRVLKKSGDGYVVGVEFDWARMSHDDITAVGEFWIGKNFLYGYHGNENYTVPTTGKKIKRKIAFTDMPAEMVLDRYYQNYDSKVDRYFYEAISLFG